MFIKEIAKKSVVPISSAFVGGLLVIAGLKLSPTVRSKISSDVHHRQSHGPHDDDTLKKQEGIRGQFDDLLNGPLMAQNDPLEQMRKMRDQMETRTNGFDIKNHPMGNPFDSWFSDPFGGGTADDISEREDDSFVYYDIQVDDVKLNSIKTKVNEGYITITGTAEKEADSESQDDRFSTRSIFKSSFNRTFPLPENVDQNKMQLLTEKDKIILKFPKTKA